MIKSTIFEPNLFFMCPKSLLKVCLFLIGFTLTAQYTEKINSNRPGTSQGAFSVGNNVLQLEGGFGFGKERHDIFETKTNVFNFDYAIRYGLLIEQLEINITGRFRADGVTRTIGANEEKINRSDFEFNTIGAKYLIYDPYKRPREDEDSLRLEKLKSWKETHKFRWRSLIPAVSGYLGMNYVTSDNPFTFDGDPTISPKIVVMTQNNWWTSNAGSWVLVTNLIVDKVTTDNPVIGWIITSTHTLNDKWAIFGEYQGQKSDFYSDDIVRLGGAYLFNKDLQIDANIATNFKDTPSIFTFSFGGSYRFDWHKKDEIIEEPGMEGGVKDEEETDEELDENGERNPLDEIEEIENDSLKQQKTPFINEFEDDSFRDDMERDLDERRTAERLERERIEKEKQDKKDDKKFRKEEKRRLKREAKEAKKAEKDRLKAEKEKQKMIDEIDAELDKMEQDQGVDDELQQIDDELKKLEEMEKELEVEPKKEEPSEEKGKSSKKEEAEEDIDAAYDQLKKEEEKAKKEEEKRRKKEEKRKAKEEKKRKKEEEKAKKDAEKDKEEDNNDDNE